MATERPAYQSQLPTLINSLMGAGKTTTTTTGTANTKPLEEVFASAMNSSQMTPEQMGMLLQSIFTEGAKQVPGLTQQYANATGTRVKGNTGLQLALGDLNREITTAAATKLIDNNNLNRQTAANTAGNIAQATRSTTQTQQTGGSTAKSLAPLLLGAALNKFDKFKFGGSSTESNTGTGTGAATTPGGGMPVLNYQGVDESQLGAASGDPYGSGLYASPEPSPQLLQLTGNIDVGGLGDLGGMAGGAVDDLMNGVGLDGMDLSAPDIIGDWDTSSFTDIIDPDSIDLSGIFADGGTIAQRRKAQLDQIEDESVNGTKTAAPAPAPEKEEPKKEKSMASRIGNFIRGRGFADGGSTALSMSREDASKLRNVNYASLPGYKAPAIQAVHALNYADQLANNSNTGVSPPVQLMPTKKPRNIGESIDTSGDSGGNGVTDASNTNGVVGTPAENQAAMIGMASAVLGNVVGIPGLSSIANAALDGKSMSPISNALAAIASIVGGGSGNSPPDGLPGTIGSIGDPDGFDADADTPGIASGGIGSTAGLDASSGGIGDSAQGDSQGDSGTTGDGGAGYANGGLIRGPGTGTSDSIPVRVSDTEYILPADVVRYWGTRHIDRMVQAVHKPVNR